MSMDGAALLAAFSFAIQIAAGVAPMRWPQHTWLAGWIFWGACIFAICCSVVWGVSNWGWLMTEIKPISLAWLGVIILAIALVWYDLQSPGVENSQVIANGKSTSTSSQSAKVGGAKLKLLLRPNHDPQELSNDNVWRWLFIQNVGKDSKGKAILSGSYIFLVFDKPIIGGYRQVTSPSHPDMKFVIPELTERSMLVFIGDTNPLGATVEIVVSDKAI